MFLQLAVLVMAVAGCKMNGVRRLSGWSSMK